MEILFKAGLAIILVGLVIVLYRRSKKKVIEKPEVQYVSEANIEQVVKPSGRKIVRKNVDAVVEDKKENNEGNNKSKRPRTTRKSNSKTDSEQS